MLISKIPRKINCQRSVIYHNESYREGGTGLYIKGEIRVHHGEKFSIERGNYICQDLEVRECGYAQLSYSDLG